MAEIRLSSLRIRQTSVLQQPQQDAQHIRMCLFDLVEQDDRPRTAADLFGQLSALAVSFISGRRADQTGDVVRLLILGQIDADQTVPSEQKLRQRTAHRGLADTGRTGEQQRCLRPSAVAQSGGAPPDRPADACDRLPLSDHRLREHRLHLQHPRAVSLRQLMISLAALRSRRHICGDNLPAPLQMHRRAGLVQQVDRLVRQKPLRTDAHGQPNRLLRHARTQRDPMMGLIPRRDALQNAQCGLLVRLAHVDALKPPVERGVLLNRLVVFLHRCRPDQPDFSARKCRLEQIGGVNRPLRRTRTHQRVYLVDKRNHALVRAQLAHNAPQTLLKLAAVLGSRDQ